MGVVTIGNKYRWGNRFLIRPYALANHVNRKILTGSLPGGFQVFTVGLPPSSEF